MTDEGPNPISSGWGWKYSKYSKLAASAIQISHCKPLSDYLDFVVTLSCRPMSTCHRLANSSLVRVCVRQARVSRFESHLRQLSIWNQKNLAKENSDVRWQLGGSANTIIIWNLISAIGKMGNSYWKWQLC